MGWTNRGPERTGPEQEQDGEREGEKKKSGDSGPLLSTHQRPLDTHTQQNGLLHPVPGFL